MTSRLAITSFLAAVLTAINPPRAIAISVGETDNFSTNLEGWAQGEPSTLAGGVTRVTSGGPGGANDPYMRIVSDGSGEHGKLLAFNGTSAWTGNYTAGVSALSMSVNNLGATDLRLRLAFGTADSPDTGGSWLSSASAVQVPPGSGWMSIQFPIGTADMTRVQGTASYSSIMGNVSMLRLLHSNTLNNRGVNIVASLGVDNITALSAAPIAGDFDGNRIVNAADLGKWQAGFGMNAGSDADQDGDSDGADFLVWQRQLGSGAATAALRAVPLVAVVGYIQRTEPQPSKTETGT
jgi:hypothetical protein